MTEYELRDLVAGIAEDYAESGEIYTGSEGLQKLIDVYNAHKPLARNIPYKYSLGGWCELFADVCFIEADLADLITTEIGPWEAMQAAKEKGIWKPKGAYVPQRGDKIYYAYKKVDSNGRKTLQHHVGIVTNADSSVVFSTEGNVQEKVMMLVHNTNDQDIIGYIAPDYASMATPDLSISELPSPPRKNGTYSLKAVVSNTGTTFKWE